jgi:hypothetical protein
VNHILTKDEEREAFRPLADALRSYVEKLMADMKPGETRTIALGSGFAPFTVTKDYTGARPLKTFEIS